jgi:hypothetical protein
VGESSAFICHAVVERAAEGFGIGKSSVSRAFVLASAAEVKRLTQRRFDDMPFLAVFIDGVDYAGETMIVALGVTEQGDKRILGLRQGATGMPPCAPACSRNCATVACGPISRCCSCSMAPRR